MTDVSSATKAQVDTFLTDLDEAAQKPRETARALPPYMYISPEFLELEQSLIFDRAWTAVCRQADLAEVGAYTTLQIGAEPIFVVRDEQMQIKAFSNVCRHRLGPLLSVEV